MKYAFEVVNLDLIQGNHYRGNPASGRVMQKVGMKHEHARRRNSKRWGRRVVYEEYRITKAEYFASFA